MPKLEGYSVEISLHLFSDPLSRTFSVGWLEKKKKTVEPGPACTWLFLCQCMGWDLLVQRLILLIQEWVWLQDPYVLPEMTLDLCSSPDVWHWMLPTQQASCRRPGCVSGSCGSFLLDPVSPTSCSQLHQWLKTLLTILQGCGPDPQHLIIMLSKPFQLWIKKEQSEISAQSPAAHIIEGFYSLTPMGHCKPWLTQQARRYSPQETMQFWYTTHLDQHRRKQGRWEEICGTQLEDEGMKTGHNRTTANFQEIQHHENEILLDRE